MRVAARAIVKGERCIAVPLLVVVVVAMVVTMVAVVLVEVRGGRPVLGGARGAERRRREGWLGGQVRECEEHNSGGEGLAWGRGEGEGI